jgi:hypothetical protein
VILLELALNALLPVTHLGPLAAKVSRLALGHVLDRARYGAHPGADFRKTRDCALYGEGRTINRSEPIPLGDPALQKRSGPSGVILRHRPLDYIRRRSIGKLNYPAVCGAHLYGHYSTFPE